MANNHSELEKRLWDAADELRAKSASAGVMTDVDIVLPPDSLREMFEDHARTLRQLLNNLLDKNAKLRRTRDLLLPKLISGEVDVSALEICERVHRRVRSLPRRISGWRDSPVGTYFINPTNVSPISAGVLATAMPQDSNALILSAAEPLPPLMIAPA